ncbi:MAG: Rrf2 family transcriptional regulator [Saprospiraceae bacterium]|nr:Rrf2 family transcriptional regulator [Saprospiraceae bacterium]
MLTQKAKYAIKALVHLAKSDGLAKTKDIAERCHIPKKFLESILIELKNHHLVESVQGAHGGYRLLKKPENISLADIHRMFEGPIALTYCASLNFYKVCTDCDDLATCEVRRAMTYVRIQTLQALQDITVRRMVDGNDLPA